MKAKITAKILIALCCIISLMPFCFSNAAAETITPTGTFSSSNVYWSDDPIDSRYQIGTVYISLKLNATTSGYIYFHIGSDNSYAPGYVGYSHMYSLNGATCEESGTWNYTTPVTYGESWKVSWMDADELLFVYEYKVIKTVNTGTNGPIDMLCLEAVNSNILVGGDSFFYDWFEEYTQLTLNDIADSLYTQNNDYWPAILSNAYNVQQTLEDLYIDAVNPSTISTWGMGYYKELTANATYYNTAGYINGNNGKIYLDLTTNRVADWNGYFLVNHFYRLFLRTGNQGSDIDIVQNFKFNGIWIFNRTTGEKHFYDTSYYKYYLINSSGTTTLYLWDIYIPFNSSYKMILEFTGSTNNNTMIFNSTGSTVSDWTYTYNEYYEMTYRFSVLNGIERIIGAIGDISVEQTINIDNTYNELNTYNTQINTITNNYNTQFTDLNQQLEFDDLVDVDPESENNILNTVNFYNSVFAEIIEVPSVKQILIFLLLCILIVGLIG